MSSGPVEPIDDGAFSAWLDNELPPPQAQDVEHWLRRHPQDARRVQGWADDASALRRLFDSVLHEPVPAAQQRLARPPRPEAANGARWTWVAAAAGLLLTGGLIGAGLAWHVRAPALVAGTEAAAPAGGWPQRAALAHSIYVPETRHPVEVPVAGIPDEAQQRAQEEHLARWLTRRLALQVKLFDLRDQDFELVGGRLLPDQPSPGAQLMYQRRSDGERVTVYLRKPEADTPAGFRYEQQGDNGMFYWVEGGAGYALVGKLPRERLLALAEDIHRQCPSKAAARAAAAAASAR